MESIEGVLFEPVGCLAEFPSEPFLEMAARLFGAGEAPAKSGSDSYWRFLTLMESSGRELTPSEKTIAENLEAQAVAGASTYPDVVPALSELRAMGINLIIASSLSSAAIGRFLERCCPSEFFSAVWNRDNAGGIKAVALRKAVEDAAMKPEQTMFLTDTAEGIKVAKSAAVQSILVMNDPDEARRLAMEKPAGGIVSLHELPDFIRFVAARD